MVTTTRTPPPSPPGGLFATIRAALPGLIPSERRVAEVCLDRPEEVVQGSAADLATAARVSTATVVRACQHLGFRGFQQLRLELAREWGATAVHGARPPGPDDQPDQLVDAVFASAAEVLTGALGPLDRAQIGPAVDILAAAGRLLVLGNGGSAPVAQDAALRFAVMGRPAEAPADAIIQQVTGRLLTPSDACLAITSSGANEPTLMAAEAARAAGAPVIAISSYSAGPITETADILLVVGAPNQPFGSDVIASRLASLLLIHALQLAVQRRRPEDFTRTSDALRDVLVNMTRGERPAAARLGRPARRGLRRP